MGLRYGLLRSVKTATIAENENLSDVVDCNGLTLAALIVPSGWTAADITLQGSVDGTNFFNVHEASSDTELTVQAAASRYILLDPDQFRGLQRLKVRSGTSATPVTQTGSDKVLTLVLID